MYISIPIKVHTEAILFLQSKDKELEVTWMGICKYKVMWRLLDWFSVRNILLQWI